MPIVRVENWLSVEWKYRVAPEILQACMSARVPGIDHERKVTVVFGGEIILRNNNVVVVFVEGLFTRRERTKKVRDRLARMIGDAVRTQLPDGYHVEVLVQRFDPRVESFYEV